MKFLSRLTAFSFLFFSLAIFSFAQKPEVKSETQSDYVQMVEKAKKGDSTVDYVKFRAAYLDWVNDECNKTEAPNRDKMVEAFEKKDWAKAAELGEIVLDYEFVSRGLQLAVAEAYKQLKNAEKEKFHTEIAQKLLKAMLDSGDGKTAKTAYKVHSIREEYVIMRELGYQVGMQALVFDKEYGAFDILSGTNAEGKKGEFYFDINSFFGGGKSKPCKKT